MNSENSTTVEKIPSKEDAIASIGVLMQETNVMGANDSEIPALMDLMKKVKSGDMDPEEAVKEATAIRFGKQDYH